MSVTETATGMKKFINEADDVVKESLQGLGAAHADLVIPAQLRVQLHGAAGVAHHVFGARRREPAEHAREERRVGGGKEGSANAPTGTAITPGAAAVS